MTTNDRCESSVWRRVCVEMYYCKKTKHNNVKRYHDVSAENKTYDNKQTFVSTVADMYLDCVQNYYRQASCAWCPPVVDCRGKLIMKYMLLEALHSL